MSGFCPFNMQQIQIGNELPFTLTLYLLVSSADNFCKQGSKLFDTLMVFLKEIFEKVDADDKNTQKIPQEPKS